MSQETHSITRSSHSAESNKSSRHRQSAILAEINERITRLGDRPTPRRLRVIQQDLAQHTRLATGRNDIIGTYAHVAVLQRDVIDGQNAHHLLSGQYQLHLRTQLAAKSRPKAPGGVLKSGFGALDEEALCILEAEQDAKVAIEEAKIAARETRAAAKALKESELAARAEARLEAALLKEAEKETAKAEERSPDPVPDTTPETDSVKDDRRAQDAQKPTGKKEPEEDVAAGAEKMENKQEEKNGQPDENSHKDKA